MAIVYCLLSIQSRRSKNWWKYICDKDYQQSWNEKIWEKELLSTLDEYISGCFRFLIFDLYKKSESSGVAKWIWWSCNTIVEFKRSKKFETFLKKRTNAVSIENRLEPKDFLDSSVLINSLLLL